MIFDLISLHILDDIRFTTIQYFPSYVCSKRTVIRRNSTISSSVFYYVRKCNKKQEEVVNRCTWLANEVGQLFVYEQDKKWCNKEKGLYKSIWTYT